MPQELDRIKHLAGLQEQDNKPIMINGKQVDVQSIDIVLGPSDPTNRDDLEDRAAEAVPKQAFFMDGTELSDAELEVLKDQYHEEIFELAYEMAMQGLSLIHISEPTRPY